MWAGERDMRWSKSDGILVSFVIFMVLSVGYADSQAAPILLLDQEYHVSGSVEGRYFDTTWHEVPRDEYDETSDVPIMRYVPIPTTWYRAISRTSLDYQPETHAYQVGIGAEVSGWYGTSPPPEELDWDVHSEAAAEASIRFRPMVDQLTIDIESYILITFRHDVSIILRDLTVPQDHLNFTQNDLGGYYQGVIDLPVDPSHDYELYLYGHVKRVPDHYWNEVTVTITPEPDTLAACTFMIPLLVRRRR